MASGIADSFQDAGISMVSGKEYKEFVKDKTAMIMLFAEWCPHCIAAKPGYLDMAERIEKYNNKVSSSKKISLGAMDFDLKTSEPFKKDFDAFLVPTFVLFSSTGKSQVYSGSRTGENLLKQLQDFEKEERKKYGIA